MDIFKGLTVGRCRWEVQNVRLLCAEEKDFIRCAIVVKSQFGLSLEFFTRKGRTQIPISMKERPSIGYIPDIDKIKIITLYKEDEELPIYRIEF